MNWGSVADWVTAISAFLSVLSIFVLRRQLVHQSRQMDADHERSRREKAIALMQFWCELPDTTASYFVCGRRIVQILTKQECVSLSKLQPFSLSETYKDLLECFRSDLHLRFPLHSKGLVEKGLRLDVLELLILRTIAITYLNRLETIATAWRHNVADREIIEEEFIKVFSPETHSFVMGNYRQVCGLYPSIGLLVNYLEEKRKDKKVKTPISSEALIRE